MVFDGLVGTPTIEGGCVMTVKHPSFAFLRDEDVRYWHKQDALKGQDRSHLWVL